MPEKTTQLPDILEGLLEEVLTARDLIVSQVEREPENKDYHRVYGMYIGQILDIRKEIQKTQALNLNNLLLTALVGVADFLLENKEQQAALLFGDHLEWLGDQIKKDWENMGKKATSKKVYVKSRKKPKSPSTPKKKSVKNSP